MERSAHHETPHPAINFLKDAKVDGAIERYKSKPANYIPARNLNITGLYFGTYLEQADIANMYGLTRQRVNQVIQKTIKNIWNQSSTATKSRYPQSTLTKHVPFEQKIDQFSKTEKAELVQDLSVQGLSNAQISEDTGVKEMFVSGLLLMEHNKKENATRIARLGIRKTKALIEKVIHESEDLEAVQRAFDILTLGMATNLVKNYSEEFVSMAHLFETSPTRQFPKVVEELRKANLPVMRIDRGKGKKGYRTTNYYIREKDKNVVIDYLENNTSFKPSQNKVSVFLGEMQTKPTTTELGRNYVSAFSGIGRHANHQALKKRGLTQNDILTGAPVRVIAYRKTLYVSKDDFEKMQRFLSKRLKQVGIPTKN